MRIEILVIEGCPHTLPAKAAVERALNLCRSQASVEEIVVRDIGRSGFAGSPTILINGRDVEPSESCCSTLRCRIYPNPENPGVPGLASLLRAIRQAALEEPR